MPSNSSAFPPIAFQNCIVTCSAYFLRSSGDNVPAASVTTQAGLLGRWWSPGAKPH